MYLTTRMHVWRSGQWVVFVVVIGVGGGRGDSIFTYVPKVFVRGA